MRPTTLLLALAVSASGQPATAAGDTEEGARGFRACAACHTLEPGEHRTGPSLAGIFGRAAGSAPGFTRYSPALERAEIVWDTATLDAWLAGPAALIPDNRMTFPGIPDARARADLIAYLETATTGWRAPFGARRSRHDGCLGDGRPAAGHGTEQPGRLDPALRRRLHGRVESGETHQFWEFNLRFKTELQRQGPRTGAPVLIPASMMGDRAFVIFAGPDEISARIASKCE